MKAAMASRDKWRRVLVEVALGHEQMETGGSPCGAQRFPCVTRRQLELSNLGIAKEVELLEALPEEEFRALLYGSDDAIAHIE